MRVTRLNEGITHIEDLSIDKFIDTIKSIFKFHVSEKIDGANLWFGLDDSDIFYTTREQKSGDKDRKYESKDYSKVAAYNGFRSAHDALQSFMKLGKYRGALHPGDKIEIEVVFGKQPNVVKYSDEGINYIVLLRPVDGTSQEHFDKLVSMLDGKEVNVQSEIIDTVDGESKYYGIAVEKNKDPLLARPVVAWTGETVTVAVGAELNLITDAYVDANGEDISDWTGYGATATVKATDDLSFSVRGAYKNADEGDSYSVGPGIAYQNFYIAYLNGKNENDATKDTKYNVAYASYKIPAVMGIDNFDMYLGTSWGNQKIGDDSATEEYGGRVRFKYFF